SCGSPVWALVGRGVLGLVGGGAVCVVDRLAAGGEAIAEAAGAPFRALVTIDELYPDRPDRDR
ncbi:MAG: phosphoribosyltransferase, partial [Actinomycetota bacterium]